VINVYGVSPNFVASFMCKLLPTSIGGKMGGVETWVTGQMASVSLSKWLKSLESI